MRTTCARSKARGGCIKTIFFSAPGERLKETDFRFYENCTLLSFTLQLPPPGKKQKTKNRPAFEKNFN